MTAKGKIVLTLVVLLFVGTAAWKWWPRLATRTSTQQGGSEARTSSNADASGPAPAELVETQTEAPKLAPATAYQPKDNIVDVELSEYAGYAGLIVANGGLEPNENSVFAKKHGIKVRIKLSEEESWSALNIGKMAGMVAPYPTLGEASKRAAGSFFMPGLFSPRTRAVVRFLARFG